MVAQYLGKFYEKEFDRNWSVNWVLLRMDMTTNMLS